MKTEIKVNGEKRPVDVDDQPVGMIIFEQTGFNGRRIIASEFSVNDSDAMSFSGKSGEIQ